MRGVMYLEGFNTQPPEGGCKMGLEVSQSGGSFNTQPREGGCFMVGKISKITPDVSTHSRAKAAALSTCKTTALLPSFNTQPREGGCGRRQINLEGKIMFQHTAARRRLPGHHFVLWHGFACFNTQPREGGCLLSSLFPQNIRVSTHSRAKAAATTRGVR